MSEAFWMVLRDSGGRALAPVHRHGSLAEAQAEARRLVGREGCRFYILEAVGFAEPQPAPVVQQMFADEYPTVRPAE